MPIHQRTHCSDDLLLLNSSIPITQSSRGWISEMGPFQKNHAQKLQSRQFLGWINSVLLPVLKLDMSSLSSQPVVSNGKRITQIPETNMTNSNRRMDAVLWQPWTKLTATRGHIIPPILPIELATPRPVVRTDVGHICSDTEKAA
ncbi:hypothetical protein AKJ16_DCAP25633 [Drosera capensis]